MCAGHYLVLVTGCELAGYVRGASVYRVTDTSIVPCGPRSAPHHSDEQRYLALLRLALRKTKRMYFSPRYDLTRCLQSQHAAAASPMRRTERSTAWERADHTFCWNEHIGGTLAREAPGCEAMLVPVICGFFGAARVRLAKQHDQQVVVTLLCRTSPVRAGIRNHCRGADTEGAVANYVETEQILEFAEGGVESFECGTGGKWF